MKKTTLVFLLLAAAIGGYVYYSEFRHATEKPAEDAPKPLYTFSGDDVTSIRVTRAGEGAPTTVMERGADGWKLTSPVPARADRMVAESLAGTLARIASARSLPADPARMKEFGLAPPEATVEIHLKSGQTQKLELGGRDFSDMNVYAREAGAKDVLLVPNSVLTEVARPVNELRDRSLVDLGAWSLVELDFHTPKTKFRLEKKGVSWDLAEPRSAPADGQEEETLSNTLAGARFTDVVEENFQDSPAAAARYGFSPPQLTIHVRNEQGAEATLLVGKNDGGKYFARDASRPLVFRIEDAVPKKFLDATFTSLHDKRVLRAAAGDFSQFTVRNEKQTMSATLSAAGKWLVDEPAARKGKEVTVARIFDPLTNSRALEVLDPPSASVAAKLAKPLVELKLKEKTGGVTTVEVSAAYGDFVYVRSSRSPAVFKFESYFLGQLNFTAEEISP